MDSLGLACRGRDCNGVRDLGDDYIGMLAFHLPIPVEYDWRIVLLALLSVVLASAVALHVVGREKISEGLSNRQHCYGMRLYRYNLLRSPVVLVSSLTGRTSIVPTRAGGICEASWIASFRSAA
jgi:hypothetical protein